MIAAVSSVVESFYLQVAVKAKFSLAFFALLRPGEITTKSQKVKNDKGILQFQDVLIKKDKGVKMVYITMNILNTIHHKDLLPFKFVNKKKSYVQSGIWLNI